MSDDISTQLAREIALAALVHAAEQYVMVARQVQVGDSTQEMLRAARARLERQALRYAAAHGWQPGDAAPGAGATTGPST